MQTLEVISVKLKKSGHRLTKIRMAILALLIKTNAPLSSPDLQSLLWQKKISANKTTVYRELAFLKKQNIVREVQFRDGVKRYEIMPENHHHHMICVDCGKIEDVELEKDLDKEERMISKNMNFKIINHSLEFYGYCRKCQT